MKQTEEAWPGALRIAGTGNGKPSRYVCGRCLRPSNGVYRVKRDSSQAETWLCSSCRSTVTPKQGQPEWLRKTPAIELGMEQ